MAGALPVFPVTFRRVKAPIQRTQRYPQYSDHELIPFFAEIAKGYPVDQAADRCLYPRKWIMNTLYSDDDTYCYVIDLSMVAGAMIRSGQMPAPADRYDGLYNDYL